MAGKKNKSKNKQQSTSEKTKKSGRSKTQLISTANEFYKARTEFVNKLKNDGHNPYPHKFNVTISLNNFIDEFSYLDKETINKDKEYSLAGRIISKREYGDKLVFYDLNGEGSKIQLVADQSIFLNKTEFEELNDTLKRGDIVGCIGWPGRTKTGEFRVRNLIIILH